MHMHMHIVQHRRTGIMPGYLFYMQLANSDNLNIQPGVVVGRYRAEDRQNVRKGGSVLLYATVVHTWLCCWVG